MVKRISVILLIILGVFISFSLYRTYAYNTTVVEDTPSTTDLEYTFKIGNSSIKEITINSGETKYYDAVMGNPNNAKISYSIYYEMVSPNTKPDNFSIEYTSKSNGDSTGKVDKNDSITLNIVVTNNSSSAVTVKLGSIAGYVNGGELVLSSGQVVIPKKPANFVETLDDGSTGDSGSGVYAVHHDAISAESSATGKEIPAITDYRYYGPSPNNYIFLDADDFQLFRIIGSIYEENAGQNLLKVITATPLTDGTTSEFSWDYKSDGTYTNIWSSITNGVNSGSTLMQLLNGIYLMRGSGSYYNGNETATTVDFSSTGLTDTTQALMNTGKDNNGLSRYYLGGFSDRYAKPADIYLSERNKTTSSGSALYWDGKVGLMYPSDYGYAAGNDCAINIAYHEYFDCSYDKNWLYNGNGNEWTMTPYSQSGVAGVYGGFGDAPSPDVLRNVHPVFYLKSDITLIGGTGTMDDPYLVQ